jgi:DNA topoisomerase-3
MNIMTKPEPSCPKCGAKMVLRRPPVGKDWEPFWGCNRYPDCKGTMNIDSVTGKPYVDEPDYEGWDGDEGD